ncbi:pancreatic lipase-related protein 2-like [Bradysia coprophila]|uniref:pancreatic lipase-related protein 2-like n=1 Tax=Bradysia coprophila TaxID=38358 RepID=UPI00187D8D3E|nr:pancreatic lipase-related protein 2-like [Bradysia coprophila]
MQLPETGFNKNLPTVFVIHGFLSGYDFIELFRAGYGTDLTRKLNLIGIDWSRGAGTWVLDYWRVLRRISTVGSAVGRFIMAAIKDNVISDPNSIHVVGHSLGAHIAGFVGKYMAESGPNSIKLRHITALDPAGPYIGSYECPRRLCDTDASFVETIHTNGGMLGRWKPIGQLDLYVNGGRRQSGCILPTCSHSFSHKWYRSVMTGTPETDGWLCKDLNEMENELFCKQAGNPRKYRFEILEIRTRELGIVYLPTPDYAYTTINRTEVFTNQPNDYTIVIFASNNDKGLVLASLLSDNGQLIVQHHNNEVIIVNPSNPAWSPDPKYHFCREVQPDGIENCLRDLRKPFKFVVAFDVDDMFTDPFWEMLFYLAKYDSQDQVFSNKLQMVATNIPHDGIVLQQHIDELKVAIDNALQVHYAAVFQMAGMHVIEHNGVIAQMSQLVSELVDIKNAVDH